MALSGVISYFQWILDEKVKTLRVSIRIISKYDSFPIFLPPYHHRHLFTPPAFFFCHHELDPQWGLTHTVLSRLQVIV